ncbi:MAG: DUF3775 domain-containing protein [Blastocatellales bacterium]
MTLDGQTLDKIIALADRLKNKNFADSQARGDRNPTVEEILNYHQSPEYQDLYKSIANLSSQARRELLALMWIGRGDFSFDDWSAALKHARPDPVDQAAGYIIGKSLRLPDYLRAALEGPKREYHAYCGGEIDVQEDQSVCLRCGTRGEALYDEEGYD